MTEEFISLMFGNGLLPLITKPTRITHNSHSLIDNIFSSDKLGSTAALVSLDLSDHEALLLMDTTVEMWGNIATAEVRCTKPHIMDILASKFGEFDFGEVIKCNDVNKAYDDFYEIMDKLITEHLPLKVIKTKPKILSKPWYSTGLKQSNKITANK